MRELLALCLGTIALTACATTGGADEPRLRGEGECDASGVQDMIGQKATQELGAQLIQSTGATQLRWVPPNTAVTMDYRMDRLTVSYDDTMIIGKISCG